MTNILQIIAERLKDYPDLRVDKTSNSITVIPKFGDCFSVTITEGRFNYIVVFDTWRLGFRKNEEGARSAVNLLMFGLSSFCRIKIFRKAGIDYQWDVEYLQDGKWLKGVSSRLLTSMSGDEQEIRYLQNDIISEDLTVSFLTIINESKRIWIRFIFVICTVTALSYLFKTIGYGDFLAAVLLFSPLFIIPYFLIQNGIDCWFDCRKIRITQKYKVKASENIQTNRTFVWFAATWTILWGILTFFFYLHFGKETLGYFVIFGPFLLCAFLVPILVVQKRSKR